MFKVGMYITSNGQINWYISDNMDNYMHRDGKIIAGATEHWPTKELAQAVLDKHQPPHVWKHGDVFRNKSGSEFIYVIDPDDGTPSLINLQEGWIGSIEVQMRSYEIPMFLFNINDLL